MRKTGKKIHGSGWKRDPLGPAFQTNLVQAQHYLQFSAPTPEALRTDDTIPWQTVRAFAAGGHHEFRIKTLGPVLWRKAGADLPLRLIVIAPLGYRLRKGSRLLYRQPAYLLCTDPDMSLEEFLQSYLWRWGIEVNFRDEKNLIGTGDAHVRTIASNQHLPAVTVAAYALLWVAALISLAKSQSLTFLRPPKWRKDHRKTGCLPSTGDLLRLLRAEIWGRALKPGGFDHFATDPPPDTSAQKPAPDLSATLFVAA